MINGARYIQTCMMTYRDDDDV